VGLDNALGDFVCFLDSDDYYHEAFILKMLQKLNKNPEYSGAYCTSFDIVENAVRRSSNVSFDNIMPTLFDEHRPWATCSWLWRRESLPKWTNERSNEDSLFEINVAMNNNKIGHVNEVLCYIDKGTGKNTIDLLGSKKNELDRNKVLQFCIQNLSRFKSDQREIGEGCLRRLLYVSARLLRLGERGIVEENIKFLQKHKIQRGQYKSVWLLKIGILLSLFSKSFGFNLLEWNRVNSKGRYS
jgi:glycosyltransferase involved in cell wall biosynthesis